MWNGAPICDHEAINLVKKMADGFRRNGRKTFGHQLLRLLKCTICVGTKLWKAVISERGDGDDSLCFALTQASSIGLSSQWNFGRKRQQWPRLSRSCWIFGFLAMKSLWSDKQRCMQHQWFVELLLSGPGTGSRPPRVAMALPIRLM